MTVTIYALLLLGNLQGEMIKTLSHDPINFLIQGDISAPAVTFSAPQKTENLIFQAPKIGPVKLCPDDLLAVYDPPTQGVILVTRAQYDKVRNECYLKLPHVCPSITAPAQSP